MLANTRAVGRWGETMAVHFLLRQGYVVRATNFQVRGGEIDIVAREGGTLCFIEVKLRTAGDGSAERATDRRKLSRLARAARAYCFRHRIDTATTSIRFEHVSLYLDRRRSILRCIKYLLPL